MSFPPISPPENICILRLSAIGDICHSLPVVRTIQAHWPTTKITWVIGKTEATLIGDIAGINFIIFDKNRGINAYREVYSKIKHLHFEILLHMQMSLRASLISLFIKADIKLGFDCPRAKDFQCLFTNKQIKHISQQHVMESFFGFSEALGISQHHYTWDIPVSESVKQSAHNIIKDISNYVIISPCSSMNYRNWHIQGYAAIADYIHEKHGYNVILTGGNSTLEREYGNDIVALCKTKPLDIIGKTSLKQLLFIIEHAKCMISPDSGPAHLATTVKTPVIGLYAATNPDRARPYFSAKWTVNCYPDAIFKKFNKAVAQVNWGARVKDDWAMKLIAIDDVIPLLDACINNQPT